VSSLNGKSNGSGWGDNAAPPDAWLASRLFEIHAGRRSDDVAGDGIARSNEYADPTAHQVEADRAAGQLALDQGDVGAVAVCFDSIVPVGINKGIDYVHRVGRVGAS
jgi:hypothetical protein